MTVLLRVDPYASGGFPIIVIQHPAQSLVPPGILAKPN
jgi:hypothetical protein